MPAFSGWREALRGGATVPVRGRIAFWRFGVRRAWWGQLQSTDRHAFPVGTMSGCELGSLQRVV